MRHFIGAFVAQSLLLCSLQGVSQGVGVNANGNPPDSSAGLDVHFTDRGALLPRMTAAQRDLIQLPAKGLLIYNLDCDNFNYNAGTPQSPNWQPMNPSVVAPPPVPGNITGLTQVCVNQSGLVYSVDPVPGATYYEWSLPPGAVIQSGEESAEITITMGSSSGTLCVRAVNPCAASGQSCISPVVTGSAAGTPTANPSSWVSQQSLVANWTAVPGVSGYYLDVASDNGFTAFVPGYNNLDVGNTIQYQVTGLTCNTTYHFRVRAYTNCGPGASSNTVTVSTSTCFTCGTTLTDPRDGRTYGTVALGTRCWMSSNLNFGSLVTYTVGAQNAGGVQKYCQSNNEANCTTYGGLYEWSEVMQGSPSCNGTGAAFPGCAQPVQGICPPSWHVASHYEWTEAERNAGASPDAFPYNGTTDGWLGTNEGTNIKAGGSTGLNMLMGGRGWNGGFDSMNAAGLVWTSSDYDETGAWSRHWDANDPRSLRAVDPKGFGYAQSVRCVKD